MTCYFHMLYAITLKQHKSCRCFCGLFFVLDPSYQQVCEALVTETHCRDLHEVLMLSHKTQAHQSGDSSNVHQSRGRCRILIQNNKPSLGVRIGYSSKAHHTSYSYVVIIRLFAISPLPWTVQIFISCLAFFWSL